MACDDTRFDAIIENKIPLVLSVGALDMVNFGARDTIPPAFADRKIHVHNEQVKYNTTFQSLSFIWLPKFVCMAFAKFPLSFIFLL